MNVPNNIDDTAASGPPSVGQTVTIRSRQYDVRHVDDRGGFYAWFHPHDGSDPSDHCWPPGTNWAPALPRVGQRAKLGRIVERFPHFSIAAGSAGTVTEATPDLIALTMDEQISGAEEWDNALCWSADDAAHYPGSPTERIAAAIYADVELIDGFDEAAAFDCTDEQRAGIGESKGNFAANNEVELIGLRVLQDGDEFGGFPDGALIVEFSYREAGNDDRDRPGREVTVFAADGDVLDSQDFG
jgi:hypothetical protein